MNHLYLVSAEVSVEIEASSEAEAERLVKSQLPWTADSIYTEQISEEEDDG